MKFTLLLNKITISDEIGIMEEIWSDLSSVNNEYSPPDWLLSMLTRFYDFSKKE